MPRLRLQPGQQALTRAQKAAARRFAEATIQAYLSTEPVDEPEAEGFLRQAYAAAGLDPPHHIHWLDGPLQLVAVLASSSVRDSVRASVRDSVETSVRDSVRASVQTSVWDSVGRSVWARVGASVWHSVRASVETNVEDSVVDSVWDSVRAYADAGWLAHYHFFDEYLAPNALHALAHFNTRVSGYWLGREVALVVRRPKVLSRDAHGRLHSATDTCLEYHDGWGFYAWHGVRVPEQVILRPETLTRQDFLNAPNIEMRRVIQECMGSRFVGELGGVVMDSSPRGTLYEVRLPEDDPERVARYVQVQDASTERQYFLRVPPTIQTAVEAVAWSFGLSVETYGPAQET